MTTGFDGSKCLQGSGNLTLGEKFSQGKINSFFQALPDYPIPSWRGFGVNCNKRVICGGGRGSSGPLKDVFHWTQNQFVGIEPLKFARSHCSSVYVPLAIGKQDGVLLVAGGSGKGRNNMEYLIINDSFSYNEWRICKDKLPYNVSSHQMTIYRNKIILSGGEITNLGFQSATNKVWVGHILFNNELIVSWISFKPMLEHRHGYVSFLIKDKLYCVGGYRKKSTEYYSFTNNLWKKGPDLPFELYWAKCVVNELTNQCFIVGGVQYDKVSSKVYLFDPIKGLLEARGNIDIGRRSHIAVLL